MQALSVDDYARLQHLVRRYQQRFATEIYRSPRRNPHLNVDLLCFQPFAGELCGALLTPLSLSLALVSPTPGDFAAASVRRVALPGGSYPFAPVDLGDGEGLWACELLDDLSDLDSLAEANRLAQHLLARVMTPVE